VAEGGMKKGNGAIRMSVAFALLFVSLALVVWRQSRALEDLRGLDAARATRAVLQAERSELQREIQSAGGPDADRRRGRRAARLRTPAATEITILQAPSSRSPDAVPVPVRRTC
jgi:hypothetical protein